MSSSRSSHRIHADIERGPLDAAVAPGTGAILIRRCSTKEFLDIFITISAKKKITEQVKRKQKLELNELLNCTSCCTLHLLYLHTKPV